MHITLKVETTGQGLYEVTPRVVEWLIGGPEEGLLTLYIRHTSASLLIQENADPDVTADLAAFLRRLVPSGDDPTMAWLTHTYEGPDDMPGHIKAALLPTSVQIPVVGGRMVLGQWQGIYLVEHRDARHQRDIFAMLS